MTDIFVSYAHEDSTAADVLANDLLSLGWTVWRDDRIEVSDIFDDVIEARLDGASCVVVIWSPSSVRSRWVRAEAAAADEQGKLIPVCFHPDIVLPMRFRQIKAAMLPSPQLDQHEKSARAFLAEVARLTGITPASLDHLLPAQRASSRPGTNAVTVGNWALRAQNLRTRFSGGNLNLRLFPDGSAVGDLVFRSERPWKAVNARHKQVGRWRYDLGSGTLLLEMTGFGATLDQMHAMTAMRISVVSWQDRDMAVCMVDGGKGWTLERRFGV